MFNDLVITFVVRLPGEAMRRAVQSVIAACVLASASPAAAQIINGSFEEGTFGGGSVREVPRGDTALSGWTVIESPIAWYTNGYEPNPLKPIGVAPHSGNLAVNLCDGSVANLCDGSVRPVSISQTFTVLPFVEQQLTFWVGNYGGNRGPVSIKVTITDGTSNTLLLSETAMAPASNLDSTWQEFTYSYTSQIPDGTSNTIVFSEIGGGGYYAGLDDISVASVPKPSTWALALLGFVGLGIVGMRRRRLTPA